MPSTPARLGSPLAWACVVLIALLLALAVATWFTSQRLEREVRSIQADSVPGLINAHTVRALDAESFGAVLIALASETEPERAAALRRIEQLDAAVVVALRNYEKSIVIDPKQDRANLEALQVARTEFVRRRTAFLAQLERGPRAETLRLLRDDLLPGFEALMAAGNVVVAYNDRTGTTISASMLETTARLRWAVIAVALVTVATGLGVGASVFRQRRVDAALRESESKFSTAFQLSPNAMAISRRDDGRIIAANDAMKRQYAGEIIGRTAVEIGVWRDAAERAAVLASPDGRLSNLVRERELPDGRTLTSLLSVEPIRLGDVDCMLSVSQDITELTAARQALERSGAELRALFESAAMGMALVNPAGRLIRVNPALEQFLGYSSDELRTLSFAQVTHPEDVPRDLHLFQKLIAGELSSYQLEKRYLRKDGNVVWAHLTVSVVRDSAGKLVYGIGVVEDITERRRAELALRESEAARENLHQQLIVAQKLEAIGQLAGGVAHDFNNLLSAMMLYIDLIKSEPAVSPGMRDGLTELTNAARRAAGLTRQLLLFSRREPAQRQAVDLNTIVSNLLKMLSRLVGEHFTLVQTGPPEPLLLYADAGMIEQVVMNLVVNARDAMPGGGQILLRLEETVVDADHAARHPRGRVGRFARLTVVDTGCGMSAATLARIFEPFFTTKEAGKGTGLGLSTVFGIVEQHGGWIEVQSEEGKGSTFVIYLPLHETPRAERTSETAPAPHAAGRETILLAEDDDPVRLGTAGVLRQNGYHVLEACNGRQARELLQAHEGRIDLLLSDVMMPGGLLGDALVRELPRHRRPQVILMSGHNSQLDLDALEAAGVIYLSKPFDSDRLLRIVRAVLDASIRARA